MAVDSLRPLVSSGALLIVDVSEDHVTVGSHVRDPRTASPWLVLLEGVHIDTLVQYKGMKQSFKLVARRPGFRLGGRLGAIVAVRARKHSDKSTYDENINIHVIEASVVVLHEVCVFLALHRLIFDVLYAILRHVR